MKQLVLSGISPFAAAPIDAPYEVVAGCASEASAVRQSIEFARKSLGVNQLTIAKLCGWRSSSFLSEIAKEANEKRFPPERIGKFTLATGTRLLEQWIERRDAERQASGKTTEADRAKAAVAAMVNELRRAAA